MDRRRFLAYGLVAPSLATLAQQQERVRRIGLLLPVAKDDSDYPELVGAFLSTLKQLGWDDGRNLRVETRWAGGGAEMNRRYAAELVTLAPDVILASGASAAGPLLQETRTIPVVFTIVPDAVGAGFVDNLARPGGNATGFISFDYGIGAKWLELLKEIAPRVKRVGVVRDSTTTAGVGQWGAIQTAAPRFGMEASSINLKDAPDLERAVAAFARPGSAGLIVTSSGLAMAHRDAIVASATKNRLPAVYYADGFVATGGLASYGSERRDQFRRAAGYVDRILKGERPGDLPVQAPVKYELLVNIKAAQAIGVTLSQTLLMRADRVIQ